MSTNFHCSPWNWHSSRPNCCRVSACSRARLNAWRPSASARAALPSRSMLKPAIWRLKPPAPSSRLDPDPRPPAFDEDRADAGDARAEAQIDQKQRGLRAVGGKQLGAVDHVMLTVGAG